jgi:hypothetical protein
MIKELDRLDWQNTFFIFLQEVMNFMFSSEVTILIVTLTSSLRNKSEACSY